MNKKNKRNIITLLLAAAMTVSMAASFSGCVISVPQTSAESSAATESKTESKEESKTEESKTEGSTESKTEESKETSENNDTSDNAAEQTSQESTESEAAQTSDESQVSAQESSKSNTGWDISVPSVPEISIPDIGDTSRSESSAAAAPQGTVNASYAGTYKARMTFASLGITDEDLAELEASELAQMQQELDDLSFTIVLNANGTAVVDYHSADDSGDSQDGTWIANDSSIYVTVDGDTQEFEYSASAKTLYCKTLDLTFDKI